MQITLEPLSKFPVIEDLAVDRGIMQEDLIRAGDYRERIAEPSAREFDHQYLAGRCLKCGLCLEVCPNYRSGGDFYGAYFANETYLVNSSAGGGDTRIRKEFRRHFAAHCSKSLSCQEVCPMNIPTLSSMLYMNKNRH